MPIYIDKTTFTGPSLDATSQSPDQLYLTITGPGPVAVEQRGEDGVWRSFPQTTFSGTQAQIVTIRRGMYRIVITAAAATTVEVSLW